MKSVCLSINTFTSLRSRLVMMSLVVLVSLLLSQPLLVPQVNAEPTTATETIKINFQPKSASIPKDYLIDDGSTFGKKEGGYSYGWDIDMRGLTYDRNQRNSPDQRYDTLIYMQKSKENPSWEIGLPNGSYKIRLVAGDPIYQTSFFKIEAEGILIIDDKPNSRERWLDKTATVTIKDGRLTLGSAKGAYKNKLNFIEISPLSTEPPLPSWQLVKTETSPPLRGENLMAYHSEQKVTVLYGHEGRWPYKNSTWQFDGKDWQMLESELPEAVYGATMAYYDKAGVIVLFGGSNAYDEPLAQTWHYDGKSWQKAFPRSSPSSRTYSAMVYHPPTGSIFLFGGNHEEQYYNDLWQYDGENWARPETNGEHPVPRSLHAMAYNPDDGTILLFGGRRKDGTLLSDLWSFNPAEDNSWKQLRNEGPKARMAHSMIYSPALRKVVLMGGMTDNGDRILSDTWHYDSSTGWKDTSYTAALPKAAYHHLIYDGTEEAILLFTNGETWQYK